MVQINLLYLDERPLSIHWNFVTWICVSGNFWTVTMWNKRNSVLWRCYRKWDIVHWFNRMLPFIWIFDLYIRLSLEFKNRVFRTESENRSIWQSETQLNHCEDSNLFLFPLSSMDSIAVSASWRAMLQFQTFPVFPECSCSLVSYPLIWMFLTFFQRCMCTFSQLENYLWELNKKTQPN